MIRRIVIRDYRGIAEQDIAVPETGALIRGRNGAGKTSVLRAIETALLARDISPEAIRKGSDKAEILVSLDDHSVRRVITPKGATLTVTRDGMRASSPQAYLTELLGTSSLDPMDLLLLRGKARRAKILEALPLTTSVEQLRQWVPTLPDSFDASGHALEVLDRLHTKAYEQRARANAEVKIAAQKAADADAALQLATAALPLDMHETESVERAEQAARNASAHLMSLRARADEHRRAESRTQDVRARIVRLRAEAEQWATGLEDFSQADVDAYRTKTTVLAERIKVLRTQLRELESEHAEATRRLTDCERMTSAYHQALERAETLRAEAANLEAAISVASEPVSDEALARAVVAEADATRAMHAARDVQRAKEKHASIAAAAKQSADELAALKANAVRLDDIVRKLANDAPAALLAATSDVAGLTLRNDEILVDGISLDALCGAEQIRFCVRVAKRLNVKSRILVVDGLERLDPEQLDAFIGAATSDGWQLLATKVDAGEIVIEAIEPREAAAAE